METAQTLSKKSVSELKELLKEKGLPVSGKKDDLVKRLTGEDSSKKRKAEDEEGSKTPSLKKKKSEVTEEDGSDEGNDSQGTDLGPTDFTQPELKGDHHKIVTFNVAGFRAVLKKGFEKYLKDENPTIICLNETKVDQSTFTEDHFPGYYSYFYSCKDNVGYSGTAILTKIKPISLTRGIGVDEHDTEGRVITAEFKSFYLVASYIPNSGKKDPENKTNPWPKNLEKRLDWDNHFQLYLQKLDKIKPVLWCGDLNVAHHPIDLKNPKTNLKTAGFTEKERNSFTKFLSSGFEDVYRKKYPTETDCYTYWSFFRNQRAKNAGWRLDYFVSSTRFYEKIEAIYRREKVTGSDHCPLVVHINKIEFEEL